MAMRWGKELHSTSSSTEFACSADAAVGTSQNLHNGRREVVVVAGVVVSDDFPLLPLASSLFVVFPEAMVFCKRPVVCTLHTVRRLVFAAESNSTTNPRHVSNSCVRVRVVCWAHTLQCSPFPHKNTGKNALWQPSYVYYVAFLQI